MELSCVRSCVHASPVIFKISYYIVILYFVKELKAAESAASRLKQMGERLDLLHIAEFIVHFPTVCNITNRKLLTWNKKLVNNKSYYKQGPRKTTISIFK